MSPVAGQRPSGSVGTAHHGHHLDRLLAGLDREPGPARRRTNLDVARGLAARPAIIKTLQEYRTDPRLLRWAANRSYRHVNHFDKIVLSDRGDPRGYRLTLHLWEPPYTAPEIDDELIHDHRFSFWSVVLAGRLTSQNFTVTAMAAGADRTGLYRRYSYSPEKIGSITHGNFYEYQGTAKLTMTGTVVEPAGGAYHLDYRQTHRVVLPAESMVCTLVLRGPRERGHSNVYNTTYPSTDVESGNEMFSVDALAAKLDRIIAKINAPTT